MDEKTNAQNVDMQDEFVDEPAFEEEDELFDMSMADNIATEMLEQQQEMDQFLEMESFAAKFSENWVVSLPTDPAKVNTLINTQLARKKRRA